MFFQSLESRTLLSASPINPTIAADRLAVQADLLKFKSDIASYTATLQTDCQALKSADLKQDSILAPLFKTLHNDVQAMHKQLAADRLAESAAVLKDQSNIVADLIQLAADKGNKPAVTADKAKLRSDRIQLQQDEIAGLNARISTRQADYTQVFSNLNAITTAIGNDANASPALKAAVATFVTDRTSCLNTLEGDLQAIETARTKLSNDLTSLESST